MRSRPPRPAIVRSVTHEVGPCSLHGGKGLGHVRRGSADHQVRLGIEHELIAVEDHRWSSTRRRRDFAARFRFAFRGAHADKLNAASKYAFRRRVASRFQARRR